MRKEPSPNLQLYQSVQRVLDKLVDLVEDKILGLDITGIIRCWNYVRVNSLFQIGFEVIHTKHYWLIKD